MSTTTIVTLYSSLDRNAGAVLQSHSKHVILASMLYGSEFKMKGFEMIKRIRNPVQGRAFRNDEEIVVPIIENKCFETDLAARYSHHCFEQGKGLGMSFSFPSIRYLNYTQFFL